MDVIIAADTDRLISKVVSECLVSIGDDVTARIVAVVAPVAAVVTVGHLDALLML